MILNYLKLAARLMVRNPFNTALNIACLSVGFAVFFILWQHAQNELASDQFHHDYERIVRAGVVMNSTVGVTKTFGSIPGRTSPKIKENFSDVEDALEIYNQGNFYSPIFGHQNDLFLSRVMDNGERIRFVEERISYADSNLFNFFSIRLLKGDRTSVLGSLRATVLSERIAKKYFGDVDPVGQILYLNDSLPLKVTGVFEDLKSNTHLNFNIVISTSRLGLENFRGYQLAHTYFKLREGVDHATLKDKLSRFSQSYFHDFAKGSNYTVRPEIFFEPLKDVPYHWFICDTFVAKSRSFLVILAILSIAILGMAWVNYVNLTLAAYQKRIRELGARKAVGATTADLVGQFLTESILINIISFFAALTIAQLMKGVSATLFNFYVPDLTRIEAPTWGILVAVLGSGVLVSGLYPALITLKATPKGLFGAWKSSSIRNIPGQVLATIQYTLAIVLVAWVIAISLQINFILTKNIGINKDNVIVVDLPANRDRNFELSLRYLIKEVEQYPSVTATTISTSVVGDSNPMPFVLHMPNGSNFAVDTNGGVDEKFLPFYDIRLIAGRNFMADHPADFESIIVSKTTTQQMGFSKPEDALGFEFKDPKVRVIGVVENYAVRPLLSEYASESRELRGTALIFGNSARSSFVKNKVAIRLRAGDHAVDVIPTLLSVFKKAFPDSLFHCYLQESHVNQYYSEERIFMRQIFLFTGIAVGIACLGLLGMISNRAMASTKEIGIRKVLGAGARHIAGLLLETTSRQVGIATVIGIPLAYLMVQQYLLRYTDRIFLSWWHYLLPVLMVLLIMLATVVSILVNAARANPVDSLRHE